MKNWLPFRVRVPSVPLDDRLPDRSAMPLAATGRACCCPARPVVTVILPSAAGRPRLADLLLCGHHYRVSRAALHAARAAVYDQAGTLITGTLAHQQPACRESAAAAPIQR
jgi:hypothetical protein